MLSKQYKSSRSLVDVISRNRCLVIKLILSISAGNSACVYTCAEYVCECVWAKRSDTVTVATFQELSVEVQSP